jgi:formylglycine-generating enzyme required for sulfatase activity
MHRQGTTVLRRVLVAIIFAVMATVPWGCNSGSPTRPVTTLPAIDTVSIPAGTFPMGDTNSAIGMGDSTPVHSVTLGAFCISRTPVTQGQYAAVMGIDPAYFDSGSNWPVERVSWYDAALFCNALSKLAGKDTVYVYRHGTIDSTVVIDYTKNGYRLPTEAEYEYACRAGTTTDFYWGRNYPPLDFADTAALDSNAVWSFDSIDISMSISVTDSGNDTVPDTSFVAINSTKRVGSRKPNALGLYDMSGNVWEWCNDWQGRYSDTGQTDPTGPATGGARVLRGGAWYVDDPRYLCSAFRLGLNPVGALNNIGFRVVCGVRP